MKKKKYKLPKKGGRVSTNTKTKGRRNGKK